MKRRDFLQSVAVIAGTSVLLQKTVGFANTKQKTTPILVIHGGTSSLNATKEEIIARQNGMRASLEAGQKVLAQGGTAEEAVLVAIKVMEDDPLFNAGKGAVFNADGVNELDASIMLGNGRKAGAVTGVTTVKNPIEAAKVVMDKTPHTLIGGKGGDQLAKKYKLTIVNQKYFYTDFRYKSLLDAKKQENILLDSENPTSKQSNNKTLAEPYLGTVGAIALDSFGDLVAGTSTGGMTNKMAGRIGDSPIIGAGNYADNKSVAVSCTGTGDIFIRVCAAHEVAALFTYGKRSIQQSAEDAIQQVAELGGTGGIIAIDKFGNPGYAWTKNKLGMYHGMARIDGKPVVFSPLG